MRRIDLSTSAEIRRDLDLHPGGDAVDPDLSPGRGLERGPHAGGADA